MDNVKLHEPLGNSDHNQIHFDINVKSERKNKKTYMRNFRKCNYKDMRKYLAKLDWNNMLLNKTAVECWNIIKYDIEFIIDKCVPLKNKETSLEEGKKERKKKNITPLFKKLSRNKPQLQSSVFNISCM